MSVTLRGVGWDHPRCTGPLQAAAVRWQAATGVAVTWDLRSLRAFNDTPIEQLAASYDLLVIDHPMIPAATHHLTPLDVGSRWVGLTQASYRWEGRQWALPVDVACHVAALRPDLLQRLDEPCPATWAAALELARRRPGAVWLSLTPADAMCVLLTIAACLGTPIAPDRPVPLAAIELLVALAAAVPPGCLDLNPPRLLDRMARSDDVAYVPALFGYADAVSRADGGVRYAPVPAGASSTGVLGGAGIAVAATTAHPQQAADFAAWLAGEEVGGDVIAAHGGQAAVAAVWQQSDGGGFVDQTRTAVEAAFVRPLDPRWPQLHRRGGQVLNDRLRVGTLAADLHRDMERLFVTQGAQGSQAARR